jgi:antitoxin (DNA-binding transcriptional repressor) of toxin-antitoxin stability system
MTRNRSRPRASGRSGAHGSRVVSASEAAKNFGALVERVREARATYVVERAGVPVVEIAPVAWTRPTVADLVGWLRAPERLDESYLAEVERGVAYLNEPSIPANRWAS